MEKKLTVCGFFTLFLENILQWLNSLALQLNASRNRQNYGFAKFSVTLIVLNQTTNLSENITHYLKERLYQKY